MAFTGTLLAVGLAGFGVGEIVSSMSSSPKAPGIPALPNQTTATQSAQDSQNAQRRAALASGGLTDYTSGTGIVLGSDIKSVNLTGS